MAPILQQRNQKQIYKVLKLVLPTNAVTLLLIKISYASLINNMSLVL